MGKKYLRTMCNSFYRNLAMLLSSMLAMGNLLHFVTPNADYHYSWGLFWIFLFIAIVCGIGNIYAEFKNLEETE